LKGKKLSLSLSPVSLLRGACKRLDKIARVDLASLDLDRVCGQKKVERREWKIEWNLSWEQDTGNSKTHNRA
jgi:hypothetical protein